MFFENLQPGKRKRTTSLGDVLNEAARISKQQPIIRKYEIRDTLGKEFDDVFRSAFSYYKTSDFLIKLTELERDRADVNQVKMGTVIFQDTYYVELLGKHQAPVAHEAYAMGKAMKNPLTDYAYYVIDNGLGNDVGVVKMPHLSAYERHFDLGQIPQKVKDKLCAAIVDMVNVGVTVPRTALAYHPQKKDFKLLEYDMVRVHPTAPDKQKEEYIAAVKARLMGSDQ